MSSTDERFYAIVYQHFPDAKMYGNTRKGGTEWAIDCPFCHKKNKLWINLTSGFAKCWNASCSHHNKLGSFKKLLAEYLEISYEEAQDRIDNNTSLADISDRAKEVFAKFDQLSSLKRDTYNIFPEGAIRITEEDDYFCNWLENVREPGWDPEWFLNYFEVFKLHQKPFKKRAIFKIRTNEDVAYLAYSAFPGAMVKHLNPEGAVLSRMIANYNNFKRDVVFICEGFFSMARTVKTGEDTNIWDAGCLFGVSMSNVQAKLINECPAKKIIFLYDYGAEKAAMKNVELIVGNLDIGDKEYFAHSIPFSVKKEDGGVKGLDPDDLGDERLTEHLLECLEKKQFRRVVTGFENARGILDNW